MISFHFVTVGQGKRDVMAWAHRLLTQFLMVERVLEGGGKRRMLGQKGGTV